MSKKQQGEKTVREPLFHIVKRDAIPWWQSWLIRAAAIFAALLLTGILSLIVLKENPFSIYSSMFSGIFGTERRIMMFLRSSRYSSARLPRWRVCSISAAKFPTAS